MRLCTNFISKKSHYFIFNRSKLYQLNFTFKVNLKLFVSGGRFIFLNMINRQHQTFVPQISKKIMRVNYYTQKILRVLIDFEKKAITTKNIFFLKSQSRIILINRISTQLFAIFCCFNEGSAQCFFNFVLSKWFQCIN